jgi:hypothetical protein
MRIICQPDTEREAIPPRAWFFFLLLSFSSSLSFPPFLFVSPLELAESRHSHCVTRYGTTRRQSQSSSDWHRHCDQGHHCPSHWCPPSLRTSPVLDQPLPDPTRHNDQDSPSRPATSTVTAANDITLVPVAACCRCERHSSSTTMARYSRSSKPMPAKKRTRRPRAYKRMRAEVREHVTM